MPKPVSRAYSRLSREAVLLLASAIREARIEKRLTTKELAERAGISRGLVHRIERADMGCAIGAVFEVAAILGLALFNADRDGLAVQVETKREKLVLLPSRVRRSTPVVNDDF